jgi:hypothetical protein
MDNNNTMIHSINRSLWSIARHGARFWVAMLVLVVSLPCQASPPQGDASDRWRPVSPDGSRMRIAMPGEPKLSAPVIKPLPDKEVTVHLAMVTQNDGKSLFLVGYHDLDFLPQDEQKKNDVLEGGVKGTVLNTLGKLTKHTPVTLGEHPGRSFEYSGNRFGQQVQGVSRIYLVGSRVYQLTVLFTPELDVGTDAEKFFSSFELLPAD